MYEAESRRPSLVSALSTAYTVKSLPGAMLYIPLDHANEYNTPIALKRSLSDPEIYFPSAVKHSLIVAVNGLLSARNATTGVFSYGSGHMINGGSNNSHGGSFVGSITTGGDHNHYQINGGGSNGSNGGSVVVTTHHPVKEKAMSAKSAIRPPLRRESTLQIDINVIQPTPNISPTCSMRKVLLCKKE